MKTHEEAREFDTKLAALYGENDAVADRIDTTMSQLHSLAGDRKVWVGRNSVWQMSHSEARTACSEVAAGDSYRAPGIAKILLTWHELTERHHELIEKISDQDRIYRQDPWSRFILCLSHDGHIHSMHGCSTLHPTSRLEWHPELSGLTEEVAVNTLGPILCTVCFKDAPVEHKRNPSEWKRERDAGAIAARKAAREEAKYAKILRPEEVIRFHDGFSTQHIQTVNGCKEVLRTEVEFRDYYGSGEHTCHGAYVEVVHKVIAILLAREARLAGTGATQAEIDKLIENAIKKNRKAGARI